MGGKESNVIGSSKEEVSSNRSQKLKSLKQQVNKAGSKITHAQKEIETVRDVLADARRRLDQMKMQHVQNFETKQNHQN